MKKLLVTLLVLLLIAGVLGGTYFFVSSDFDSKKEEKNKKIVALTRKDFEVAVDAACEGFQTKFFEQTELNSDLSNSDEVVEDLLMFQDELDDLIFEFNKIEPESQYSKDWDKTVSKVGDVRDLIAQLADIVNKAAGYSDELKGAVNIDEVNAINAKINAGYLQYQDLVIQLTSATDGISELQSNLGLRSCLEYFSE